MDQPQNGRPNNWIWIVLILLHLTLPVLALLAQLTGYLLWLPIPWLWPLVVALSSVFAAALVKKPNGSRSLWLLPILILYLFICQYLLLIPLNLHSALFLFELLFHELI